MSLLQGEQKTIIKILNLCDFVFLISRKLRMYCVTCLYLGLINLVKLERNGGILNEIAQLHFMNGKKKWDLMK